jgi:hypothetical protein
MYAASVRAGFSSEFCRALPLHLQNFQIDQCPFVNLPDRGEGRWGERLTATKMSACRWLEPFPGCSYRVSRVTPEKRLRDPRCVGLRSDRDARDVARE